MAWRVWYLRWRCSRVWRCGSSKGFSPHLWKYENGRHKLRPAFSGILRHSNRFLAGALAALALFAGGAAHAIHPDELETMVKFYDQTGGSAFWGSLSIGWDGSDAISSSNDPCLWAVPGGAVMCDASGHVTRLSFANRGISGTLPDLSALSQLTTVKLENNNLGGSIPNLPASLELFYANNNKLSGAIPALPDSLDAFYVQDNELSAMPLKLPASLGTFFAYNNKLTGSIPALPAGLVYFRVQDNMLTGTIPALPAGLSDFRVENNDLTGAIPKLPASLHYFYAANNRLAGEIPNLARSAVVYFDATHNYLSGPIPDFPATLGVFLVRENLLSGLPPEPKNVHTASLCFNLLNRPSTAPATLAAVWSGVTWDPAWSEWNDANCGASAIGYYVSVKGVPAPEGEMVCSPDPVKYGESSTCTAKPKQGYAFAGALDIAPASAGATCTSAGCKVWPKSDVTVRGIFKLAPPGNTTAVPTLGGAGLAFTALALPAFAAPALRRRKKSDTRKK